MDFKDKVKGQGLSVIMSTRDEGRMLNNVTTSEVYYRP